MTAGNDPPSPDDPGASRPRSGPADVPAALVVAARNGDPAAFARLLEHWDVHLRPFVHHTLAGDGSTDRVLAAAYLRAYRGLPRYRAAQTPGLWLHRIAYLAAVEELRRLTREPSRRRVRTHPAPEPGLPEVDPPALGTVAQALRDLAPDQRAIATMVDLEGFGPDAVAGAFDTASTIVVNRLGWARSVLADAAGPALLSEALTPRLTEDRLAAGVRTALAGLAVPAPAPGFWPDLGRRLLAERDRPAALTPDPVAGLARSHPAEPGFRPGSGTASVSTLATQADRRRPRRRWGRPLALGGAVVVVAGVVAGAVTVGISGRTPDGSLSGAELAAAMAEALDSSRYLRVDALIDDPDNHSLGDDTTSGAPQPFRLTLGDDGSWAVARTDTIDQTTYEGTTGLLRRVVVVPGEAGKDPVILSSEDTGLAAGAPDPAAAPVALLADLRTIGTLLSAGAERRAPATRVGGVATWTYRRTVATGDGGDEVWQVAIRRSDGFPMRIERRRDGELVRRIRFSGWRPASEVPDDTFEQTLPGDGAKAATAHGFAPVDLPGVALLGRGDAVTPAWLPDGFELATVAIRGEAPAGAPATAGGTNPPDVAVMSLAYQRGPERITITTRGTTAPVGDWRDPFATEDGTDDDPPGRRTLGDGRFNQSQVRIGTDAVGRAQLWGIDDDTVFTVGGDLTAADVFRVAASLR